MTPLGAALALLLAASPFKAEQPSVREGNEKLRAGDAGGALTSYGRGEAEVGAHPEIDFDRGNALQAQGQTEAAQQAWAKAADAARTGPLASKALQNTGSALDAAGDQAGAMRAFAEALRRDPGNEDARYNLEALLRRKAAEKQRQQDQKKDPRGQGGDQEKRQEGKDPKEGPSKTDPQQGEPEAEPKDETGQQGKPDQQGPPRPDGQQGGGGGEAERPREGSDTAGARADAIGKQDAERLLDAMRARERSVPPRAAPRKDARRRDVEKDW